MQSKQLAFSKVLFCVAFATLSCVAANAQTVGNLSQIQAETLVLKARASRAAAQVDLESKSRQTIGEGDLPMIRAMTNVSGKRSVILAYGNGSSIEAKVSDSIPGGYVVSAISAEGVTLMKGGKSYSPARQPMSSSAYTSGQQAYPGAPVPTVPMPR